LGGFFRFEADRFAAVSLNQALEIVSHAALKYRRKHKKAPVLIIDNVNRLAQNQKESLDLFQDYAKLAADEGIVTVVLKETGRELL
jgi:hypothetical protein